MFVDFVSFFSILYPATRKWRGVMLHRASVHPAVSASFPISNSSSVLFMNFLETIFGMSGLGL